MRRVEVEADARGAVKRDRRARIPLVAAQIASICIVAGAHAATVSVPAALSGGNGRDVVVPVRLSPTNGVTDLSLALGYDASERTLVINPAAGPDQDADLLPHTGHPVRHSLS